MIDERDWSRLARYFAGECPADEALETQRWLASDNERAAEAERLRDLWAASKVPEWRPDSNEAWQRLAARMHVGNELAPVALHRPSSHAPRRSHFQWQPRANGRRGLIGALIAASLVIGAGFTMSSVRDRLARVVRSEVMPEPQSREYRTARGQRAVIILGDGSRVELGAESVLRVRPFDGGARVLFLEGQAVFDVVHDTMHKFVVHSGNAITEDLGTRFVVRAYRGDARVQVLVSSGKVALRAAGAPSTSGTLLGPSDLGVIDSLGRTTVRNGVDSSAYTAWTRDRFVFEDAPLSEVIPEVARWFDVRIEVRDTAALAKRVTLNVPARSLSEVLGAITVPLKLRSTTTDRTVVIR